MISVLFCFYTRIHICPIFPRKYCLYSANDPFPFSQSPQNKSIGCKHAFRRGATVSWVFAVIAPRFLPTRHIAEHGAQCFLRLRGVGFSGSWTISVLECLTPWVLWRSCLCDGTCVLNVCVSVCMCVQCRPSSANRRQRVHTVHTQSCASLGRYKRCDTVGTN